MSQKKTKNSVSFEALSSLDAPVSFWKGIPFGLQHVMAMFVANLAPIFIVANAAKMTSAQSAAVIQSGLLVAGLGTCLQLYGAWLIGSPPPRREDTELGGRASRSPMWPPRPRSAPTRVTEPWSAR